MRYHGEIQDPLYLKDVALIRGCVALPLKHSSVSISDRAWQGWFVSAPSYLEPPLERLVNWDDSIPGAGIIWVAFPHVSGS